MSAPGPYETDREAGEDARPVYGAMRTGPVGSMAAANERKLVDACREAGVELGAYDRRIITWLAGWDPETVQVVVGIVSRARRGGA